MPTAFEGSVKNAMKLKGVTFANALDEVQTQYEGFVNRNERLTQKQNDLSNNAQVQLISHFALLATLSLTVTGFLITQTAQPLTEPQKSLIILIFSLQTLSLFFGALDFMQTISFHRKWAKLYQAIGRDVAAKVSSGEIQEINSLGEIEEGYYKKAPESTNNYVTIWMVSLCLLGLALLILLFYTYFFDVPLWSNP